MGPLSAANAWQDFNKETGGESVLKAWNKPGKAGIKGIRCCSVAEPMLQLQVGAMLLQLQNKAASMDLGLNPRRKCASGHDIYKSWTHCGSDVKPFM